MAAALNFTEKEYSTLEQAIDNVKDELTSLSNLIHSTPELGNEEYQAHKNITDYFQQYIDKSQYASNFKLTRSAYNIPTAFEVVFTSPNSAKGPTVGFNSEYDALPEIGHACGHNLIAVAGISAFIGVAETMAKHNLPGKAVLLGTPAEESTGGKIDLLKAGAYEQLDTVMMTHPTPSLIKDQPTHSRTMGSLARLRFLANFKGHPAHASLAPWEGKNALDGAVLAYNALAVLRQQIRPDCRMHCIIPGGGTVVNVVPDTAQIEVTVRAPQSSVMHDLKERAVTSIKGAAAAAHVECEIEMGVEYAEVVGSDPLGDLYEGYLENHPKYSKEVVMFKGAQGSAASTDFGNVTFVKPGIHPIFGITSEPGCANHTRGFTKYANTPFAHQQNFLSAKGIAASSLYVLLHPEYLKVVNDEFKAKNLPY